MSRKYTLRIPESAYARMVETQKRMKLKSLSELIVNALSLYDLLTGYLKEGRETLCFLDEDGEPVEIKIV